jgi:tryptophan-rich sensory protein
MFKDAKRGQLHSLVGMLESTAASAVSQSGKTARYLESRYHSLDLSSLPPPKRIFGPVQASLYLGVSMVAWLIGGALKHRMDVMHPTRPTVGAAPAQLVVNLACSGAFVLVKRLGATLAVLGSLSAVLAGYLVWGVRLTRFAAWLIGPYLAWVSIASAVNLQLWKLNRVMVSFLARR